METLTDHYARLTAAGDLTPDAAQQAALPEFDRIRAGLAARAAHKGWFRRAPEPPKGLYLWGGVGRGKSMLMDLFVETVPVPARRVHFHAFMQEIHAGMHAARQKGVEDALAPVAASVADGLGLLAFDEMQITDITDAMIVGRLFQSLFDAGIVVVTTSNRHPDDLYKDGLNRQLFLPFIDLIKTRMVVHEINSPTDYRQDRLAGSPTWFTPLGPETREQMQALWDDLTDGQDTPPHVLHVQKRAVEIPAFRNGVARASFYDLCGRPLGPADYLALADAARVLMLENIPRLGRSNFNEAKRFVTLIDALYEARVRLICSAAAEPEYLYVEGEGSFEFERTASRLREMQSADWAQD
ncbi:cell division protein ZapE [Roseovarius halotolerans]|uniref:AFG1-like ATPase n=1 Tax=Roseovarius halotolerans TaxID=505353 RepID=A0A1X6Z0T5_9RHOB|nr:cell division protein ZapE [Roseovarius halotolerans]RKT32460.1 cell division protein ZapE [Roseovarius halotolerans]SLN37067.1 AFG1-like ATPase [Roseovarius halotolerans]